MRQRRKGGAPRHHAREARQLKLLLGLQPLAQRVARAKERRARERLDEQRRALESAVVGSEQGGHDGEGGGDGGGC